MGRRAGGCTLLHHLGHRTQQLFEKRAGVLMLLVLSIVRIDDMLMSGVLRGEVLLLLSFRVEGGIGLSRRFRSLWSFLG